MNIPVEYKDQSGNIHNRNYSISRLAFAKHMIMAGQGYVLNPTKIIRTLAMLVLYNSYMQRRPFYQNRFSEPPIIQSDPTEKNHFSNLAGKAIADFLSKRIDNSLYTQSYEGMMRLHNHPIRGSRPDLIAFTPSAMVAIEAKGKSSAYSGDMNRHKAQSQSGPIPVNYTVASVSYNLYNQVSCKYHDPFNDNIQYDLNSLKELSKGYYSGLSEFLNENTFNVRRTSLMNEEFLEVEMSLRSIEKLFSFDLFIDKIFYPSSIYNRMRLILPEKIFDYAENGITNQLKPFKMESESIDTQRYTYIDNDRVGLILI